MSLRIEKINPTESLEYHQWSVQHGDIFCDPAWLSIQLKTSATYIIKDDSNWLGCFTMNHEKKWGIHLFRNPYFTPHISWSWQHSSNKTTSQNNTWKSAMLLMIGLLKQQPIAKIQIAFPPDIIDLQSFVWKGYNVSPRYTYHIDLRQSMENILSNLSSSHRNHFNKAKKDGIKWELSHSPQKMMELVTYTMKRKNQKFHKSYLHSILHDFCNSDNSFMCIAYSGGEAIAGATVIFNLKRAYLLFSGYNEEKKHGGAGIGCVLTLIESCKKTQIPIFDFEGSMLEEVEQYFRGFGGEIKPYLSIKNNILR
jgi:hypothetical protein